MQKQDGKGTLVVDGALVKNSGCLRVFSGDIRRYQWLDLDGFTVNFFFALPLLALAVAPAWGISFFFTWGAQAQETDQLGPMIVVRLIGLSGAITQNRLEWESLLDNDPESASRICST